MRARSLLLVVLVAGCVSERDAVGDDCPGTSVHACGVNDPASPAFHGAEVVRLGWDLAVCAGCHGDDFRGGTAQVSCTTCHEDGPDACDTCHEAVPTTGAHGAHAPDVACASCHRVPVAWDDEGHIRRDGAADPPPAEVEMTTLAAITVEPADRAGPPTFEAGTCRNVYCHGAVLGAAGGAVTQPSWAADPPGPAPCGSCHGAPPPSHADDRCEVCHPSGDAHIDGVTDVGRVDASCSGCHGSPGSPAPPRDLAGNVFSTALGVGAHQAHLTAPSQLSAPVACEVCHVVPSTVLSPGHIDTTGPAEVSAALGWDRDTATCASSYCHGNARPRWTATGEVTCGSCHGIPPASAPHTADMPLSACSTCHPALTEGHHLDGVIDAP